MNLSCSARTIKYLMFAFNLFFVISGIIIIAVGAAVKTVYTEYAEFLDTQYFSLPNMLIATGAFIFMVSFFGCCGAVKESWIMLGIFSIFLCIIFIFEFACGIAGYVLRDHTAEFVGNTLRRNLDDYKNTSDIWDLIQSTFECCGVDSYADWSGKLNSTYDLPISCCPQRSGTTGSFHCNSFTPTSTTISPTTIETSTASSTEPSTASSTEPSTASSTEPSTASSTEPSTTSSTEPSTPTSSATTTTDNTNPPPGDDSRRRKRALADEGVETTTPSNSTSPPYEVGCKSAFGDYIKKHAVQIGGCALGLAMIQIVGIVFSCHLVRQLKNGYYST